MSYVIGDEQAREIVASAETLLAALEPEVEDLTKGLRLTLAMRGVPSTGVENVMLALETYERLGYVKGRLAAVKMMRNL